MLSADLNYQRHLEILIKSICYHHTQVRFYVLTKDLTDEWFDVIGKLLAPLGSEIIPARISFDFHGFTQKEHITETTYYRLFIQELNEDRILYLDSDIVVDKPIEIFYFSDFGDNYAIAIEDFFLSPIRYDYPDFSEMKPYFNTGVILFNNIRCREYNLLERFYEKRDIFNHLPYADQDILNILLKDKWKTAERIFNYQTGIIYSSQEFYEKLPEFQQELVKTEPHIIHYTSPFKPWKVHHYASLLREKYWFYYQLTWAEIYQKHIA